MKNEKKEEKKNIDLTKNPKQTNISLTRSEKVLLVLKHHERYKSRLTTADMHSPQTSVDNLSNPQLAAMAKRQQSQRNPFVQRKKCIERHLTRTFFPLALIKKFIHVKL